MTFRLQRTRIAVGSLLFALCTGALAQTPPGLRATVGVASDFVNHGLLQTWEDPSLRLALDFEHDSGFFTGASIASADYLFEQQRGFRTPRDSQAVAYAGYSWRRRRWLTSVSVSRYVYANIARDYDYTQTAVSASYRDRYFITYSQSNNYLDFYERTQQVRAGFALPWIWNLEFGVNAGRFEFGGRFDRAYTHWDAGLSKPAGRLGIDLRFYDSTYDRSDLAGNVTRNMWVLSMTYSILPLRRRPDRR